MACSFDRPREWTAALASSSSSSLSLLPGVSALFDVLRVRFADNLLSSRSVYFDEDKWFVRSLVASIRKPLDVISLHCPLYAVCALRCVGLRVVFFFFCNTRASHEIQPINTFCVKTALSLWIIRKEMQLDSTWDILPEVAPSPFFLGNL